MTIVAVTTVLYLGAQSKLFTPVIDMRLDRFGEKFGKRHLHVMLLNVYEFREKRRTECRTFLRGVHEITF